MSASSASQPTGGSHSSTTRRFEGCGLDISPIHLPVDLRGPLSFPELARKPSFLGLPGVFADALPDRFGNAVIRRYFAGRGRPDAAMSPLQRLLYIGDRAMGALEFRPPLDAVGEHRRGTRSSGSGRPGTPRHRRRRVRRGARNHANRGKRGRSPAESTDSLGSRGEPGAFGIRPARVRRGALAHQVRRGVGGRSGTGHARPPDSGAVGTDRVRVFLHGQRMPGSRCPRRTFSETGSSRIS